MPPRKLSVISLFSGAGGLDHGFLAAGFQISVCIEADHWCCKTLRGAGMPTVIEGRLEDTSSAKILKAANLTRGKVDVLIGGPPCQPFSKSSFWKTGSSLRLKDPRASTLTEYMRVVEDTLPTVFVLENVTGLSYQGKSEGLEYLQKKVISINRKWKTRYTFSLKVLNAVDYGVPQRRERIFIVGRKDGEKFIFPPTRFTDPNCKHNQKKNKRTSWRTAWDAIGDLDDGNVHHEKCAAAGKWGILLPSIPEGWNYLWHTKRAGGAEIFTWRSRYWSFLLKLAKSKPSWTIQAQPGSAIGPFHWNNRQLTSREMARIQTFPDRVKFAGGKVAAQKQIGNAVPSLLGEVIARSIAEQVFSRAYRSPPTLSVTRRLPVPAPEAHTSAPTIIRRVKPSARALEAENKTRLATSRRVTPSDLGKGSPDRLRCAFR